MGFKNWASFEYFSIRIGFLLRFVYFIKKTKQKNNTKKKQKKQGNEFQNCECLV